MMSYCAIDLETTGLDPDQCQVLEIACVVETDWRTPVEQLPTFRAVCGPGEVRGDPYALSINAALLMEIATLECADLHGNLIDLSGFIQEHYDSDPVTIAGKNFGKLDYAFLAKSPQWKLIRHDHRFIDVGNLWWNPATDALLPNLPACCERAGVKPRAAHSAVEDCRSVIECVRAKFLKG